MCAGARHARRGWLLQLRYDDEGKIIPSQTVCLNQRLMYDDYGKNPPAVKRKNPPAVKK